MVAATVTAAEWVYFVAYGTHWKVQWNRLCAVSLVFVDIYRYIFSQEKKEKTHISLRQVQRLLLYSRILCASAISIPLNWKLFRFGFFHSTFFSPHCDNDKSNWNWLLATLLQLRKHIFILHRTNNSESRDTYRNVYNMQFELEMENFVTKIPKLSIFPLELSVTKFGWMEIQ